MNSQPCSESVSLFISGFPATRIDRDNVRPIDPGVWPRTTDELNISGIEGSTWVEITLDQARGTCDILKLLHPACLPLILPGYLKWLWDVQEADAMMLPLFRLLAHLERDIFSPQQRESISSLLKRVIDQNREQLTDEETRWINMAMANVS